MYVRVIWSSAFFIRSINVFMQVGFSKTSRSSIMWIFDSKLGSETYDINFENLLRNCYSRKNASIVEVEVCTKYIHVKVVKCWYGWSWILALIRQTQKSENILMKLKLHRLFRL